MIRMKRNRNNEGFTLLEVMVALALLSASLAVLLQGLGIGVAAFDRTRQLTKAQILARRLMTQIELSCHEPEDKKREHGDFGDAYPGYSWIYEYEKIDLEEQLGLSGVPAAAAASASPSGGDMIPFELFRLRLTILWMDGTEERDYKLVYVLGAAEE